MRLWPRSLFGRLLVIAVATTIAALLFAAFAIGHVLERFVMRGLDDRLGAQMTVLAGAVDADGRFDPARAIDLPGFDRRGSGWIWVVEGPDGRRWSNIPDPAGSLPDLVPSSGHRKGRHGSKRGEHQISRDGWLHARMLAVPTTMGEVRITAMGPRRIVDVPLREAMVPLLASLALLGVALALATLLQLRIGLRPLRALQASLAEVRAGRSRQVPADQPVELRPLADELNALIEQNDAGLASARQHVANLAHGLKTPLAALAIKVSEPGRDPDGSLAEAVGQIDDRVRHHLRRARASAPGAGARARTLLAPAVDDLVMVLRGVHAGRPVTAKVTIAPDLAVAVDAQDLDEMLGNLLDNGWRHARSAIHVDAMVEGASVVIRIEDDGPGLDDVAIDEALLPGRRLDERGDGHGFGLSITRELAELNGGRLRLSRSPRTKGLSACVELPAR